MKEINIVTLLRNFGPKKLASNQALKLQTSGSPVMFLLRKKVLFASLNYGSNLSFLPRLENQKCLGPELTKPGKRPPGDRF